MLNVQRKCKYLCIGMASVNTMFWERLYIDFKCYCVLAKVYNKHVVSSNGVIMFTYVARNHLCKLITILRLTRDFLLCKKRKRTTCLYDNIWMLRRTGSRALFACLLLYYSPRNQMTSCQYKLSKKLVRLIIEAQWVLSS